MNPTNGVPASVTVYPNGPLVVRGPVTLRHADGELIEADRVVALCRCGRSAVKPFCDGSHKRDTRADGRDGQTAGRQASAGSPASDAGPHAPVRSFAGASPRSDDRALDQ